MPGQAAPGWVRGGVGGANRAGVGPDRSDRRAKRVEPDGAKPGQLAGTAGPSQAGSGRARQVGPGRTVGQGWSSRAVPGQARPGSRGSGRTGRVGLSSQAGRAGRGQARSGRGQGRAEPGRGAGRPGRSNRRGRDETGQADPTGPGGPGRAEARRGESDRAGRTVGQAWSSRAVPGQAGPGRSQAGPGRRVRSEGQVGGRTGPGGRVGPSGQAGRGEPGRSDGSDHRVRRGRTRWIGSGRAGRAAFVACPPWPVVGGCWAWGARLGVRPWASAGCVPCCLRGRGRRSRGGPRAGRWAPAAPRRRTRVPARRSRRGRRCRTRSSVGRPW